MQDKKIIGEQNKLAILHYLYRFGYLTSRQISKLIFRKKACGLTLAQRKIADLIEDKLIIRRRVTTGNAVVLLSSKGAKLLNTEFNLHAKSGAKMKLGNPIHRCASNWHLIHELSKGHNIYTEHEIQCGRAPVSIINGKIPDGIVIIEQGVIWLEVENSWKNKAEIQKIVQFSADTLSNPNSMEQMWEDNYLVKLRILAITPYSANAMVRSYAKDFKDGCINHIALNDVQLMYAPMTTGLIYPEENEVQKFDLLEDLVLPYLAGKDVKF
jgi:hypothetical protein